MTKKPAGHRTALRNQGYDDGWKGRPMNERWADDPEYRVSYKRGRAARTNTS